MHASMRECDEPPMGATLELAAGVLTAKYLVDAPIEAAGYGATRPSGSFR